MSKTSKIIMKNFRRKLTRVIDLNLGACGFDSEIDKAIDARLEMEEWLEGEIEKLVESKNPGVDHFKVNPSLVMKGLGEQP